MTRSRRRTRWLSRIPGYIPLLALVLATACRGEQQTDWSPAAAETRGDVVNFNGHVLHAGALASFVKSVDARLSASVQVVAYDAGQDPILTTAEYDGQQVQRKREAMPDESGS